MAKTSNLFKVFLQREKETSVIYQQRKKEEEEEEMTSFLFLYIGKCIFEANLNLHRT